MAKRRSFTPEFKFRVVLELVSGAKTNAQLCREHQLAPTVVSGWKEQFLERAPEVFATPQSQSVDQHHIAALERLVGRHTLGLHVANKASNILTSLSTRNGR